jgi:hypothetical protein
MPFFAICIDSGPSTDGVRITLSCAGCFPTRAEARAIRQACPPEQQRVIIEADNISAAFAQARQHVIAIDCCAICGDELPANWSGWACDQCSDEVWRSLHP